MKLLTIAIAILICATSIAAAAAKGKGMGKIKVKIGLVTASLPWTFGPYQTQMHQLSLLLKEKNDEDEIEYDIHWLAYVQEIPKGVYKTYEQLRPKLGKTVPPPAGFPLDHITFLGNIDGKLTGSKMNLFQKEYGLDCLITLMDIARMVPDVPFALPVVSWVPLHSQTVKRTTSDYWSLRHPHAVAGLSPSGAKAIKDAVGKKMELNDWLPSDGVDSQALTDMFGSVEVDFIPHIFDRNVISADADVALEMLKDHSVAQADSKLSGMPLINRGQESSLEPHQPHSLFGEETKDDFVILLQGGNYETEDRKGWDTSIQAFARFYHSLDDPSGIHVLIHSMENYLIASDNNGLEDAPASVLPIGYNIRMAMYNYDIPREAYTIDIALHAPQVIAAYKKRASICLHPSKVEGFGMNVMECQAVGTPVITTNYTAMGDFTKIGRSVPHRQMIHHPGTLYSMALPDVMGIADALGEMYQEHLALRRGEKEALARRENEVSRFNKWIDDTCSPAVVGRKFKALLLRSFAEFEKRHVAKQKLLSAKPPTSAAYEIASGYHATIADWDAPWTLIAPDGLVIADPAQLNIRLWQVLLDNSNSIPSNMVLVLPAKYEDGTAVPIMDANNNIHEDLPFLVRTVMMTSFQGMVTRKKSFVGSVIQAAGTPGGLPPNMAIIEKKREPTEYVNYDYDEL